MKATMKSIILTTIILSMMVTACDTSAKRYERARTLYEEGTELRSQRLSEEAAESSSRLLNFSTRSRKTKRPSTSKAS